MTINCPNCSTDIPVNLSAVIPDEQVMYMELGSESEMFDVRTIAEAMLNIAKIHNCIAKEMGAKLCVMLKSMDVQPKKVTIGFAIISTKQAKPTK